MSTSEQQDISSITPHELADEAIQLVEKWLREGAKQPVDPAGKRLAGVLSDENGLDFTVGFVDGVVRPEDVGVAGKKLSELVPLTPQFLAAPLRGAIGLGGMFSRPLPGVVVPIARRVLREMVSHLIVDATDKKLGKAIAHLQGDGVRLNINLLGEAILGHKEAERRLAGTHELLARDDVDYVSIKVSSVMAPHNHWAYDEAVAHIQEKLIPLYRRAANASPQKFINLDMEEYKDLDITLDVFTQILDRPEFLKLEAGIVLQAYLPDALGAMIRLQEWSSARVARGGAPIKVRVVKGANLPMEQVHAAISGWPLATWGSKQDTDTSYKAVLDYSLHPERVKNVRVGVAGHNLFDIALAWLLAKRRDADFGLDVEMLLGMATGQAEAVKQDVGSLLLYTPVVHPEEFDVAISYLIRRLEEGASEENFMSAVFDLADSPELFEREKRRFLASLEQLTDEVPPPNRVQDRREFDDEAAERMVEALVRASQDFENTPNTDPDLHGNREWGRAIADRMVDSQLGNETVEASHVATVDKLTGIINTAVDAAAGWQALGVEERTRILHRAGMELEKRRADLLEVMGSECGKTLDQGDPEVSEAIDFAHYYATLGQELERIDGATAVSRNLTVVTPPWNFPVAIPAGGTLAALAAGSSVIIKPATQAARSGAVMVECLWEAGVPRDVLHMVQFDDRAVSTQLITDPRVDNLILTGGYETATKFREFRQDLPLLAETSGKNAIIVTPHADFDLAAQDVVQSAFGHAGQKCSAASLVILVGSVVKSRRFNAQLLDATRSLEVGTPDNLESQMGPVITAPTGKLLRGLTTLEPGEHWLIKPQLVQTDHPLASGGKLWTPGLRTKVQRGSEYHLTEYFGPILGVMTAETLDEAIDMVNEIDYGLTSGLHSLDRDELALWLDRIQAGNLYVNRGITGAIVRRQSFGGWKKSAIGPGAKAGGPNYLHGLVDWQDAPITSGSTTVSPTVMPLFEAAKKAGLTGEEQEWLGAALASDVTAIAEEFGVERDASGLVLERNVFRYTRFPVVVRIAASASLAQAVRAISTGIVAEANPTVSVERELPSEVTAQVKHAGVSITVENQTQWEARVATLARQDGPDASARIRVVAGDEDREQLVADVYRASGGKPDIAVYGNPVVSAGRVEMLPHLQEQAVSITNHRFGTLSHLSDGLIG